MTPRRAAALFVAALVLAAVISAALRDTLGYVVRQEDGHYEGDITHYVYWTRLVTLGGVQDAYGGEWPETFAVYPPVTLYGYQAVGTVYRALVDPSFDLGTALQSGWLRRAIKAHAVAWHLAAALGIYAMVRRLAGPVRAGVAGALYAANPAALFDAAHWAQPDGAHSLFSVLAVGWLATGQPLRGWAAMAFAALAKPQAWAILPLLLVAGQRQGGLASLVRGGAVGAVIALVVLSPFLLSGRLGEFFALPGVISSVMPSVSANAHNAWALWFGMRSEDPIFVRDLASFVGPLTYRSTAGLLVLAQFAATYWLYWSRRVSLAEAAALGALGWFVFTTQAHENHLFFVLPLLSLAWPGRPSLLLPFLLLTTTILANMALHDQLLLETLGSHLYDPAVLRLRTLNAALNVACFAVWLGAAALRRPQAAATPPPTSTTPLSAPA